MLLSKLCVSVFAALHLSTKNLLLFMLFVIALIALHLQNIVCCRPCWLGPKFLFHCIFKTYFSYMNFKFKWLNKFRCSEAPIFPYFLCFLSLMFTVSFYSTGPFRLWNWCVISTFLIFFFPLGFILINFCFSSFEDSPFHNLFLWGNTVVMYWIIYFLCFNALNFTILY